MVIILLSGLSQAGTAWLRVAELNDPREYFRLRQNGWVGGRTDSLFTAPLEKRGGRKGGPKTAKPRRNTPKNGKPHRIFPEYRNRAYM